MSLFDIAACPWCKGKAVLNSGLTPMYVECDTVDCCCGPSAYTAEEAVALWNSLSVKRKELVDLLNEALADLSVAKGNLAITPDERRDVIFNDPLLNKLRSAVHEAKADG